MRFLLAAINAKYIHSNPAVYSLRAYAERFCPALSGSPDSSCGAAQAGRAEIEIAEYTINQPFWEILADLSGKKPDAVGFSCYIWNRGMVFSLVRELSKVLPRVPVWLGGPEVSYDPEETLSALPSAAGVMIGEGEETFRELMELYADALPSALEFSVSEPAAPNRSAPEFSTEPAGILGHIPESPGKTPAWPLPDRIRGIAYRACPGGTVRRTPERQTVPLDQIPFFYGEQKEINDFQDRIIYYESSRGCPYRCSYCLSSIDKTVRFRNVELVKQELQFFLDKKVPQVKFVDRTFNCSHSHAVEIWSYIREHDNGVTNFHFEIAADILTEEELALLSSLRPGLVQLEIGVQSTNPDTLKEIRRVADWGRLKEIVGKIREGRNIHIHLDLIAGLPLEDMESFQRSFNDVYSCRPDQLQLGFLKVLKGSYMHEKAADYEIAYTDFPPYEVLFTRWISWADILTLKRVEEMVELYYNSAQFTHTLPLLERCFSSAFEMYRALADFYDGRGLFRKSPSRMYRYQVLLEFALQAAPEKEEVWRQLLTMDLYLRENAKSRPDFALPFRQEEEAKEKISRFYRAEEKNPRFLAEYVQAGYDSRQMARMTHVECFSLPVWEAGMGAAGEFAGENEEENGSGEFPKQESRERKESRAVWYYVLFDYRNRNPLNREARWTLLPL